MSLLTTNRLSCLWYSTTSLSYTLELALHTWQWDAGVPQGRCCCLSRNVWDATLIWAIMWTAVVLRKTNRLTTRGVIGTTKAICVAGWSTRNTDNAETLADIKRHDGGWRRRATKDNKCVGATSKTILTACEVRSGRDATEPIWTFTLCSTSTSKKQRSEKALFLCGAVGMFACVCVHVWSLSLAYK